MNDRSFNALTRRASLVSLGAAGVAALTSPMVADAKKNKTTKKAKQKCQKQAGQCLAFLSVSCGSSPDCVARAQRCCPIAGQCDFSGFIACLAAAV